MIPSTIGRVPGVTVHTTGQTATSRDFNNSMKSHAPYVFAFVFALAFLLLLITFRSIVIPLKAIVLNLLSVAASYGVLVLVFQDGHLQIAAALPVRRRHHLLAAATAGVVTSAAIVMVAVFSIFATLGLLDMKMMGVGLAVAVLLDATIVRAVLLPASHDPPR